jgi:hypothetical protein
MSLLPSSSCFHERSGLFSNLSPDPFADIRRTISEFNSLGLADSKEFHGFSVDKQNVFKIDGEATRFLLQYTPKHLDMFSCNPAAYEQHKEVLSANDSVDSAAHLWAFVFNPSIPTASR